MTGDVEFRRRKKEVIGQIQNLKKHSGKDKKTIKAEIAQLEAGLAEEFKHLAENEESGVESLAGPRKEDEQSVNASGQDGKRVSRAQRRRDKKADHAKQREADIAEQDVINRDGERQKEVEELAKRLAEMDLVLHNISPDGNCLFAALSHQISVSSPTPTEKSADELRRLAVDEIRGQPDKYGPFIDSSDVETYCQQMKTSGTWGGQIELMALARCLGRSVRVVQAGVANKSFSDENVNEKQLKEPLTVVYHQHLFSLGAHYNSVNALSAKSLSSDQ